MTDPNDTPLMSVNDTPVLSYKSDYYFGIIIEIFVDGELMSRRCCDNADETFNDYVKTFNAGREWERNKINRGDKV